MSAIHLTNTKPDDGCEICGSQQTELMSAYAGRRCQAHAPRFDPATAVAVALTDPDAAGDYVRAQWPEDGAA